MILVYLCLAAILSWLVYLGYKMGNIQSMVSFHQSSSDKNYQHTQMKLEKAIAEYYKPNTVLNAQMANVIILLTEMRHNMKLSPSPNPIPKSKSRRDLPKSAEHRKKISEAMKKRNRERNKTVVQHAVSTEGGINPPLPIYNQDPGYIEA